MTLCSKFCIETFHPKNNFFNVNCYQEYRLKIGLRNYGKEIKKLLKKLGCHLYTQIDAYEAHQTIN